VRDTLDVTIVFARNIGNSRFGGSGQLRCFYFGLQDGSRSRRKTTLLCPRREFDDTAATICVAIKDGEVAVHEG
jgi:hypothetical protein